MNRSTGAVNWEEWEAHERPYEMNGPADLALSHYGWVVVQGYLEEKCLVREWPLCAATHPWPITAMVVRTARRSGQVARP